MAIAAPQQPHNAVPLQPVFCFSASRTSVVYHGVFSKNNLFLVIEDAPTLTHEDKHIFARQFRAGASTPLDETIADKISYIYAQKIVSSGFQYYSAKDLHRRSHYMVDGPGLKKIMESCAGLKLTPPVEIIPAIVPEMEFGVEPEIMMHLKSLLEKSGKVNPRGNIVVTHGYSGQMIRIYTVYKDMYVNSNQCPVDFEIILC